MPDEAIDTSGIPEVLDWTGAVRGGIGKAKDKDDRPHYSRPANR